MITVRKSDIPEYLQKGELYRTLVEINDDPDEELTFPANVLKLDTSVNCTEDCERLLDSARFWGIENTVVKSLVDYVMWNTTDEIVEVLTKYEASSKYVYWLRQVVKESPSTKMKRAVESGIVELVQSLSTGGVAFSFDESKTAAEVGSVEVLSYLLENGCRWSMTSSGVAAERGHIHVLKYLCEKGRGTHSWDAEGAVNGGSLECLQYLVSRDRSIVGANHYWLQPAAVARGHLHIVKYLLELGIELNELVCETAALHGQLSCLRFAHELHAYWNSRTCDFAAQNGHLDCLAYAHENGCPWSAHTCAAAAISGHLDCLRYAHERGCRLRANVTVPSSNPCFEYVKQHAV